MYPAIRASLAAAVALAAGAALMGRCGAAEPAQAPAGRKLNPDLVNLPPNTWVKITPDRNPAGRSFSGVCWGNGMLFYFGGYHNSYPCNDVELYDVAANRWVQATEPEDWRDCAKWPHLTAEQVRRVKEAARGTNSPGILSPKGRPLTWPTTRRAG
jgi:hypothetical protein